jgi:hypothetical protein
VFAEKLSHAEKVYRDMLVVMRRVLGDANKDTVTTIRNTLAVARRRNLP